MEAASTPISSERRERTLHTVASFEAFYRANFRPTLRIAFGLTRDLSAAEDLTQDAFIVARQRWSVVSQYDRPEMFVRRVIVNRSRSRFRRLGREVQALLRLTRRGDHVAAMQDPAPEIWHAISELPERQAQVIVLVFFADLSVDDTADTLGCGRETVRTHLRRAKKRLANALEDHHDD